MSALHSFRFPNETASYRQFRDELLQAEIDLRRHVEKVAALRRQLPLGGAVPEDYVFDEASSDINTNDAQTLRQVKLSQLFQPGKDTLVLYSFMFGPNMKTACPMCSCMLDSLNGNAHHISRRINLAVIAKSPFERLQTFARQRGWTRLRLLSSANNNYNRDYYGEDAKGGQQPTLNVFVRRNGKIHHFWASEMVLAPSDAGQNQRHIDMIWPLWNVLDCTPEGRGTDWFPSLSYT
jgi:predicted dithiol-disulfide oxidoreductase (DUF899 family)